MSASATCKITGESGVSGILRLAQSAAAAPTTIQGEIRGLTPGKHGITVNVSGDLTEGAASTGDIFNPFGKNHGAPTDEERKVGSLGNIVVAEDGKCTVAIEDKVLDLIGPHSVIGRSIVIYASEDDCGRGGHELSLSSGNAGARVAAGVIGLAV